MTFDMAVITRISNLQSCGRGVTFDAGECAHFFELCKPLPQVLFVFTAGVIFLF